MEIITDLPPELTLIVMHKLTREDLRRLRLASLKLRDIATPVLFSETCFSLTPESWMHLQILSSSPYSKLIRKFHFKPQILPSFGFMARSVSRRDLVEENRAFLEAIDFRPFLGEYFTARARETGECIFEPKTTYYNTNLPFSYRKLMHRGRLPVRSMYDAWEKLQKRPWDAEALCNEYEALFQAQQAMVYDRDLRKSFFSVMLSFTNLVSIESVPVFENCFEQPRIRSDGSVYAYTRWLHWLMPKEILEKPNSLIPQDYHGVSWRLREEASRLVRPLNVDFLIPIERAARQSSHFRSLCDCKLEISTCPDNRCTRGSDGRLERVLQIFHDLDMRHVSTLDLQFHPGLPGHEPALKRALCSKLPMALQSAVSLATFKLSMVAKVPAAFGSTDAQGCLFQALCHLRFRRLRHVELGDVGVQEKGFVDFLVAHAQSLRCLRLQNIPLMSAESTWASVLQVLGEHLNLQKFSAQDLLPAGYDPNKPQLGLSLIRGTLKPYSRNYSGITLEDWSKWPVPAEASGFEQDGTQNDDIENLGW